MHLCPGAEEISAACFGNTGYSFPTTHLPAAGLTFLAQVPYIINLRRGKK